jgi:predicted DNA-binding transcriptional regulator YafY
VRLEGGEVEIELAVAGLAEVERWLLAYGADAIALAPPELVARLGKHAREAARQYETPQTDASAGRTEEGTAAQNP